MDVDRAELLHDSGEHLGSCLLVPHATDDPHILPDDVDGDHVDSQRRRRPRPPRAARPGPAPRRTGATYHSHAVDDARGEERRGQGRAAFEQRVAHAAPVQVREQGHGGRARAVTRVGAESSSTLAPRGSDGDPTTTRSGGVPSAARRPAHGQLRVVGQDRPGADDDGADPRAQRRARPRAQPAPVIDVGPPSAPATRPSSDTAHFQVTNGRPWTTANVHSSLTASRLVGQHAAVHVDAGRTQHARAAAGLRPSDRAGANTTARTPASSSACVHGPVRPVCRQGSRVTTAVAPAAADPASASATTSACGVPAPRW